MNAVTMRAAASEVLCTHKGLCVDKLQRRHAARSKQLRSKLSKTRATAGAARMPPHVSTYRAPPSRTALDNTWSNGLARCIASAHHNPHDCQRQIAPPRHGGTRRSDPRALPPPLGYVEKPPSPEHPPTAP